MCRVTEEVTKDVTKAIGDTNKRRGGGSSRKSGGRMAMGAAGDNSHLAAHSALYRPRKNGGGAEMPLGAVETSY
jgi:hypothetical protein